MKSVVRLLAVIAVCLLAFAIPASAQYMYLDVNGDGLNTAADVLTPSSTGVDVWLRTAHNAAGDSVVCNTDAAQLTMNSYEFFVRASGAMTLGTWTSNAALNFTGTFGDFTAGTDAYHGRSGSQLSSGTYLLGRLALSGVASGAVLSLVPGSTVNPPAFTSFGTQCSGFDFDNTYKLGSDWFDVGNTATSGPVNQNPVITAPAAASGTENSAVTVTGSATDPDADNVTLSQTNNAPFLTGPASAGPVTNPSISLTGTPNFTQSGSYTINWNAVDNTTGTAAATTALTIADLNRNPVITAPATASGSENSAVSVTASATDPDAQDILLSQSNNAPFFPPSSSIPSTANPSLTLTGTPNFSGAGTYTINWSANDFSGGTPTATTVLTIANTNRNPVITAPATVSGAENTAVSITGSATDADAQTVTLSQTNNAAFLTGPASVGPVTNPSLTLTGTPNFSQSGGYTVNWSAADATTGTATATTAITIANTDRPVVLGVISNLTVTEGSTATTPVSASDPDGEIVTLTPTGFPAFATLNAPTSGAGAVSTVVSASPPTGAAAGSPYSVSVTATAGLTSDTKSFQIIVTTGDQPPVLAAIGGKTIAEGANTDYPISATDVDGDLIEIAASLPPFGSLNPPTSGTGSVTTSFNLAPGFSAAGSHSGTVTATANGLVDSETFSITVTPTNRPPTMPAIAPITVAEGASASTPVTASDADGDLLTLQALSLPSFAVLNPPLTGTGSVTTSITATPDFSDAGSYSGSIRVSDPSNADVTSGVSITVTNTDRGPALDPIADVIVGQGGSASRNVNATDPDGDVVELSASLPSFATLNAPLSGTGSVTTTISINPLISTTIGDYPASVTARAILLTDTENFTISVTRTNQVVTIDPIADVTLDEGSSASATVNANDADGDQITLSASLPAFAQLLAPTSGTGAVSTAVTINPGFGDAGSYSASVTATDGLQPVTEPFSITVNNVDRPVALDAIADLNVAEGASASRSLNASDPDGDAITLSATLPAFATLDDNGDGSGSVVAAPGFSDAGSYPSTVTASANGTSDTKGFTISVSEVDRAPVLAAIANINVQEGASASTPVSATDADGESIELTATLPAFATLNAPTSGLGSVTTTVSASPAVGDAGVYPSSVTATANGLADTENFTINVSRPNQVPTITAPETATVDEGQLLAFQVSASDGDSDPLTISAQGVPSGASFQDNGNGTGDFSWTPNFSQAGVYSVTFTVADGRGGSNSATTAITVNNVNRCPTADAGGPYNGIVNIPVSFDGSASSDPDGNTLTYTWSFGDGGTASGATASHSYASGGVFEVNLTVGDGLCEDTDLTTATIATEFPANVFTTGGNNTTSLGAGKPTTCVQIEPVDGSFNLSDVDLSSIKMLSDGTGSVAQISAIVDKTTVDGDKNSNGVSEIRACFSKADLRLLFGGLSAGRNQVTVAIEGNLTTGGKFRGTFTHTVKATGNALAASVSPNPLNPETTLSFQIRTPGRVTVKVFDLNGRLVKSLLDDSRGAGFQDLTWNGTSDSGVKVASGVYYFRLDTPDGRIVKAATVLK